MRNHTLLIARATLILVVPGLCGSALAAEVTAASERNLRLESGNSRGISVTLSGTQLDALSSAVVVDSRRRVEKGFSVSLGRGDSSRRSVVISAPKQAPGRAVYTLRVMAGRQAIDISARVLSISVASAPTAPSGHLQITGTSLDCMDCHDNEPNRYTWDGRVVLWSDKASYGLHQQALMATLEQIIRGQKAARPDGIVCTACHGSTATNGASIHNFQTAGKAQLCSWEPLFYAANKPLGLKQFFHNWKQRNCP